MSSPATQQQQSSGDDETAMKRNTDCVYFLASPLTCKKGSECEYRHSEYARMNPTDCFFWLNSKCLNPKCTFRHPPLDGIVGTQAVGYSGSSASSSVPRLQPVATPVSNGPPTVKLGVPCVYFQKGFCSRGDSCAFSHGPSLTGHKGGPSHGPAAMPSAGFQNLKKHSGDTAKSSRENKNSEENMSKSVGAPANSKHSPFLGAAPSRNGLGTGQTINGGKSRTCPVGIDNAHREKTSLYLSNVSNGNTVMESSHFSQNHVPDNHHSKDADDSLREASPGFDVLVDNESGGHEYYNSGDQYETRGLEQRNPNSAVDYNSGYSADCRSTPDVDLDLALNPHRLDSHVIQHHALGDHRGSSDRYVGSSNQGRRNYPRSKSPGHVYESDLRHQLSKRRRADGPKPLVSYDDLYGNHGGERHSSRRNSEFTLPHENSPGSRLQGRIKLPGRASPVRGSDIRPHRDSDRERNWRRSEAGGSHISSYQGRVHDRLKDRVQDYDSYMGRSLRNPMKRTDERLDGRNANFPGPRGLAELKGQGQRIKDDQRQNECDASFEGPKPLSEILKRKRGAEATDSGNSASSLGKNKMSETESMNCLEGGTVAKHTGLSSASKEEANNQVSSNMENPRSLPSASAEETIGVSQPSQALERSEMKTDDDLIVDETAEDYKYDAEGQEEGEYGDEGEYSYEYGDEGDYNYDVENAEAEEEYLEDEDGDDFAKKIGVML